MALVGEVLFEGFADEQTGGIQALGMRGKTKAGMRRLGQACARLRQACAGLCGQASMVRTAGEFFGTQASVARTGRAKGVA